MLWRICRAEPGFHIEIGTWPGTRFVLDSIEPMATPGLILRDKLVLASMMLAGLLLRLPPLWAHRFHQDEALYASWGLLISTQRDVMLRTVPVDKPPLFLYVLAHFFTWLGPSEVVARLPGLLAGLLSIPLVYALARRLYGEHTAWVATTLFTASPMAILFSPTAFTDPLMIFFGLAGCLAAAYGGWGLAGLGIGMAAITKQQGIFFLPLVLGLGWVISGRGDAGTRGREDTETRRHLLFGYRLSVIARLAALGPTLPGRWSAPIAASLFVLGVGYPIWKAIQWDSWRYLPPDRPGFLAQSAISYGGLWLTSLAEWPARAIKWLPWLSYLTGSPWLNALLAIGLPGLAWQAWRQKLGDWKSRLLPLRSLPPQAENRPSSPVVLPTAWRTDLILLGYGLVYMALHIVVNFQIWDRYLLPLAPIVALLGARVVLTLAEATLRGWEQRFGPAARRAGVLAMTALFTLMLASPAVTAAKSGFPVGSDHGAYDGIDLVATFLRSELPSGAVLYHRWLGWHWRYYLYDVPFHFRYYDSTEALVADADGPPQIVRYIVFPGWRLAERDAAQAALAARGIVMIPRFETHRGDGSLSFVVYRIERTKLDGR